MPPMALPRDNQAQQFDISYGIYTIERLPKGSKRTPKWDLHSVADNRDTAEAHAKTLAAQPYFDHVEVKEFKTCAITKNRTVQKIKSYSRTSSKGMIVFWIVAACLFVLFLQGLI